MVKGGNEIGALAEIFLRFVAEIPQPGAHNFATSASCRLVGGAKEG
jgi:hypothetical protein